MIVYETTPCEVCGHPLSNTDPGNWWMIRTAKDEKVVGVPLHDMLCRSDWFMEQTTIYSFHKDKRIEDVI